MEQHNLPIRHLSHETILCVDFFAFDGDFLSEASWNCFGHGAVHLGMMIDEDRYIFPHPSRGLMMRNPGVIYKAHRPDFFVQLYAHEPKDPKWFDKFKGEKLSSVFWRAITEPWYNFADLGIQVNLPKRTTCASQISSILNEFGILTKAGTPQALYKELTVHPMRVG